MEESALTLSRCNFVPLLTTELEIVIALKLQVRNSGVAW